MVGLDKAKRSWRSKKLFRGSVITLYFLFSRENSKKSDRFRQKETTDPEASLLCGVDFCDFGHKVKKVSWTHLARDESEIRFKVYCHPREGKTRKCVIFGSGAPRHFGQKSLGAVRIVWRHPQCVLQSLFDPPRTRSEYFVCVLVFPPRKLAVVQI